MPIREYSSIAPEKSCAYCVGGFERVEPLECPPFPFCPECGNRVARRISTPQVGSSKSGFDDRAKRAGLHKFKKLGDGEYEKKY